MIINITFASISFNNKCISIDFQQSYSALSYFDNHLLKCKCINDTSIEPVETNRNEFIANGCGTQPIVFHVAYTALCTFTSTIPFLQALGNAGSGYGNKMTNDSLPQQLCRKLLSTHRQ